MATPKKQVAKKPEALKLSGKMVSVPQHIGAQPVAAPAPVPVRKLVVGDHNMATTAAVKVAPKNKYTPEQFLKLTKDELRQGILDEAFTGDQLIAANGILAGEMNLAKRKFEVVQTPNGEYRKGTITHRIYEFMQLPEDQALTLEEMQAKLIAEFPENGKNPDGVMTTVRCQITRQPTERGFTLGRSKDGKYSVHIAGRDNSRVLSPEAAKKRDDKVKAKAEAKALREKARTDKLDAKRVAKEATEAAKIKAVADKVAADKLIADKVAADQKAAGVPPSTVVGKVDPKKVATKK